MTPTRFCARLYRHLGRAFAAAGLAALCLGAGAQTAHKPAKARAPQTAAASVAAPQQPAPFVNGHRIGPAPSWVIDIDAPVKAPAAAAQGPGYRVLLSDVQTRLDATGEQQQYVRSRLVATEGAALAEVSKAELHFNPAYQTLTLHEAALWRDGVRHDRLKDARIELLRREERLEQSTLTGTQTLLVVLNDVRIGDAVDIAYTLHGANPITKGRFADNYQLSFGSVADVVHVRVDHPVGRTLRVKGIRADVTPQTTRDGDRESLRIVKRDVPMVRAEEQVPPWYKVWPSVHISEYADWNEVARWAEDLFSDGSDLGPELNARIDAWRGQGLPRDRLAAEVLEVVQDEVRYFSASLGESSHRPKPAARTWAERLGDCKDKVALLNAMLQRLGFDARPALVSLQRNRGIADYLPGHDQFDHVITRLELDGKVYWLDPTLQKQGRRLDTRGHPNYGRCWWCRRRARRWRAWSHRLAPPRASSSTRPGICRTSGAQRNSRRSCVCAAWLPRPGATRWLPAAASASPRTSPVPGRARCPDSRPPPRRSCATTARPTGSSSSCATNWLLSAPMHAAPSPSKRRRWKRST
ncbi:MAG TPA: DUF3857 domain-containing protein [Burkholderiaceae bacterium]|nr:DUF3857 domain-containing protein [Burkholderiaceae bacterium]